MATHGTFKFQTYESKIDIDPLASAYLISSDTAIFSAIYHVARNQGTPVFCISRHSLNSYCKLIRPNPPKKNSIKDTYISANMTLLHDVGFRILHQSNGKIVAPQRRLKCLPINSLLKIPNHFRLYSSAQFVKIGHEKYYVRLPPCASDWP